MIRSRQVPLFALALAACTSGSTGRQDRAVRPLVPSVRDSAGVRMMEHPRDALSRAPLAVVDSVPLLTYHGSLDDATADISTVGSVSFLSDDRLVGFDRASGRLALFERDGSIRRFGRQGAGPLELGRSISVLVTAGDTVYLTDRPNSRYTIFHPDTGLLYSISLQRASPIINARLLGRTDDGVFLVSRPKFEARPSDMNSVITPVFEYGTWRANDDSLVQRFTGTQGAFYQKVFHGENGTTGIVATHLAQSPAMIVAGDQHGFVGTPGDAWRIEWRDTSGVPTQTLSIPFQREAFDDEMWRRYVELGVKSAMERNPDLDADSIRAADLAAMHSDSLPVLIGLDLAPDGTIWVRDRQIPGDSSWAITALDRQGRLLGRYEAKGEPRPTAYGNGLLLFRTEDDLGIATFTVYRVHLPT